MQPSLRARRRACPTTCRAPRPAGQRVLRHAGRPTPGTTDVTRRQDRAMVALNRKLRHAEEIDHATTATGP